MKKAEAVGDVGYLDENNSLINEFVNEIKNRKRINRTNRVLCVPTKQDLKLSYELITPEIASKMLENNNSNRLLNTTVIDKYVEDLKNGEWFQNGEAIQIDENGNLLNGQHRLMAIVKSGLPFYFVIIRNIKKEDSKIYDRGRTRSVGDTLFMNGCDKRISRNAPAIARVYYNFEKNIISPSDMQINRFIAENIIDLSKIIELTQTSKGIVNAKSSYFRYSLFCALKSGENLGRIKDFIDVFRTGIPKDADKDSSAIVLRNDFASGKIIVRGGINRKQACICIENAIHDFCIFKKRIKTYSNSNERRYDWIKECGKVPNICSV